MALRLKTEWFKPELPRSAGHRASAQAVVVWRVAHEMLKRMRRADFDIDVGGPYFGFLREASIFGALVSDRIAHARLGSDERAEFTAAMVRRVAEVYEESALEWLGPPAAGAPDWQAGFLASFNEAAPGYGEFAFDVDGDGTDFGFVRYFGSRLEPLLPEKDRRWVIEQVMAAEAPEAAVLVRRGMDGLFSSAPRRPRRRAATSGD